MTPPEHIGPPPTITTPELLHVQLRDMLAVVAEILERHSVRFYLACGTALGAVRHGDLIPWDYDVDLLVPMDAYPEAVRALHSSLPSRYAVKDPGLDATYDQLFSRVHLRSAHHKYAHVDLFPLGGTFERAWAQRAQLQASAAVRWLFYGRTKLVTTGGDLGDSHVLTLAARVAARAVPRSLLLEAFRRICTLRGLRSSYLTNMVSMYLEREAMPRRLFDDRSCVRLADRTYPVPSPPEEYLERLFGDYLTPPPEEERARLRAFFDAWYLPGLRDVPLEVEP